MKPTHHIPKFHLFSRRFIFLTFGKCLVLTGLFCIVSTPSAAESANMDPSTTLWYRRPATSWQRQALPIGNGRLRAMIFGKVGHERIALNEDTVWSSLHSDPGC